MNLGLNLIQLIVIEFSNITVIILEMGNRNKGKTSRSEMSDEGTPLFI